MNWEKKFDDFKDFIRQEKLKDRRKFIRILKRLKRGKEYENGNKYWDSCLRQFNYIIQKEIDKLKNDEI